ncbi:MAG: discoidin domain-containing protein, partial [Gemmatimonadota bacterium]
MLYLSLSASATGEAQSVAPTVIDNFETSLDWTAAPSDGVALHLSSDSGLTGKAMRLDFDFQGHGGYAVARKAVALDLPDNYAFTFWVRGEAPVNNLEFKLIDSTGDNVWWMNQRNYTFPPGWKKITIRQRQIEFAWGPVGGGAAHHVAAIELAITAGSGGKGSVWIDQFQLEPRPPDQPYDRTPIVTASAIIAGHGPALVLDGDSLTSWRANATGIRDSQWITLDFLRPREFGGLSIEWERWSQSVDYNVQVSDDAHTWTDAYAARGSNGGRDEIALPESESRYLRLRLLRPAGRFFGLRSITVQPLEWAATPNAFFQAIAEKNPRRFPRYFSKRQTYWTMVGVTGDGHRGLLSQDGAFEPAAGGFSVEPFLLTGGRILSWADATPRQSLESGYLPIPSVEQRMNLRFSDLTLTVTAFAAGDRGRSSSFTRYRLQNSAARPLHATMYLAVRPFQVNPPWQFLGTPGGVARIDSLQWDGSALSVNGIVAIEPVDVPLSFGAVTFDQGDITEFLPGSGRPLPTAVHDPQGHASGVFAYPVELAPGARQDIYVRFPLSDTTVHHDLITHAAAAATLSHAAREWQALLNRTTIDLPPSAQRFEDALRSNLAYILINRDGPAIEPGARSYRRSWIRDGAMIGSALLRMGQTEPVREFIEWFVPYQYESGKVPCCVDARGSDPVPEHDSHGELIYLIAEYYRATGDRPFLEKM